MKRADALEEYTAGIASAPYSGALRNASTHSIREFGSLMTWAVTSHGLRAAPNSGMRASRIARTCAFGWGSGTPCCSARSAAMIAEPPEAATTATPGAVGLGALTKNDAVGISDS